MIFWKIVGMGNLLYFWVHSLGINYHLSVSLFQGVPQTSSLPSTSDSRKSPNDSESEVKNALLSQLQKLMTTNLVVRLNNFSMWKVSTSNAKSAPKEFISGKKHADFFCHMNFVTFVLLETIDPIDWPNCGLTFRMQFLVVQQASDKPPLPIKSRRKGAGLSIF